MKIADEKKVPAVMLALFSGKNVTGAHVPLDDKDTVRVVVGKMEKPEDHHHFTAAVDESGGVDMSKDTEGFLNGGRNR
jgi:hypothetical protein